MRLIIESNGTLEGTRLEFQMTADEIPKMLDRTRKYKNKRLRRVRPPNVEAAMTQASPILIS